MEFAQRLPPATAEGKQRRKKKVRGLGSPRLENAGELEPIDKVRQVTS